MPANNQSTKNAAGIFLVLTILTGMWLPVLLPHYLTDDHALAHSEVVEVELPLHKKWPNRSRSPLAQAPPGAARDWQVMALNTATMAVCMLLPFTGMGAVLSAQGEYDLYRGLAIPLGGTSILLAGGMTRAIALCQLNKLI